MVFRTLIFLLLACLVLAMEDWRNLARGTLIPTPGMKYVDQPYVVKMPDGRWLCMLTVGTLGEVVQGSENFSAVIFSADRGRTWSTPIRCNVAYAVPLIGPPPS